MWAADDVADRLADALRDAERALQAEQAVRGLDALEELGLHPVLASGLASGLGAGLTCLREVPYPSLPAKPVRGRAGDLRALADPATGELPSDEPVLPGGSERQRCDLVLLPPGAGGLRDPIQVHRSARAHRAAAVGTLFEAHARASEPGSEAVTPPETRSEQAGSTAPLDPHADPGDALWVEVKVIAQWCYRDCVPGPNHTYASELTRHTAADLSKLARDPLIRHAGLLLLLFTADARTAEHDIAALMHRCLDKDLPVSAPCVRQTPVADRIGNRLLTLAFIPLRATR